MKPTQRLVLLLSLCLFVLLGGRVQAAPALTLTLSDVAGTYGDTATLAAALLAADQPVAGETVQFELDGKAIGKAVTDKEGRAALKLPLTTTAGEYKLSALVGKTLRRDALLTVAKAPLKVTPVGVFRTYGQPNPELPVLLEGLRNDDPITAVGVVEASDASPVGSYAIHAQLADPKERLANYEVTRQTGDLIVGQKLLVVSTADAARPYGAENPVLTGQISGLVFDDQVTATYSTAAEPASPVGAYPVTAELTGEALKNYAPTYLLGNLAVTPAPLTVQIGDAERLYGDANPTFAARFYGLQGQDELQLTYATEATEQSRVGKYVITGTVSGDLAANYAVMVVPGTLTVAPAPLTVTPAPVARPYGAENPALTGTVDGLRNGDLLTAGYTTEATAASPVGDYPIAATLTGDARSNYIVTVVPGVLAVTPASLTVRVFDAARPYGFENPTFLAAIHGLIGEDQLTPVFQTEARPASPVGAYPVTADLVGAAATNYAITLTSGILTVEPAPLSVTPHPVTRGYGAANPLLTGTIEGLMNGDVLTATYTTPATLRSPVGIYPITAELTGAALPNYRVSYNESVLVVSPAPLQVRPVDTARFYGDENPRLVGLIEGLVAGDEITARFLTDATPESPMGAYLIMPELIDPQERLSNYVVTRWMGQLLVEPAPLIVTPPAVTRTYGHDNPEMTGTVVGLRNGDQIEVTYLPLANRKSPVGKYPIEAMVTGPGISNYQVTANRGELTVEPAPLSVQVGDARRPVGQPNPTFYGDFMGVVNDDLLDLTFTTKAAADSAPGTYEITAVLSGKAAANYTPAIATGKLVVTKPQLVVQPHDIVRAVGAKNPELTGTVIGLRKDDKIQVKYDTDAKKESPAGTYEIKATVHGSDKVLEQYEIILKTGTLTIE